MEIQANPDIEGLKLTLWIAGCAMIVMVTIIGYFLRRQIDASEKLTDSVNNLVNVITAIETQININTPITEKRLNDHSVQIKGHEKRLTKIETEHKLIHCKNEE